MIHPRDSLLNNRPLIQISRDKMRRSTNNLDTTIVRLMVRLGALERRQETVVDVDDFPGHDFAQLGAEDLHVAGQHDEVDLVLLDEV